MNPVAFVQDRWGAWRAGRLIRRVRTFERLGHLARCVDESPPSIDGGRGGALQYRVAGQEWMTRCE